MNNIRTGIPKVSGQQGIREPFNINDVIVWKTLICKFMCRKNDDRFSKSSFLRAVRDEELGSYNKYENIKAIYLSRSHYGLTGWMRNGHIYDE
jgi:hypothetical protein